MTRHVGVERWITYESEIKSLLLVARAESDFTVGFDLASDAKVHNAGSGVDVDELKSRAVAGAVILS